VVGHVLPPDPRQGLDRLEVVAAPGSAALGEPTPAPVEKSTEPSKARAVFEVFKRRAAEHAGSTVGAMSQIDLGVAMARYSDTDQGRALYQKYVAANPGDHASGGSFSTPFLRPPRRRGEGCDLGPLAVSMSRQLPMDG
jgi:hypothetical protein